MFRHVVEINGKYYIKQWGIVRMEYLSIDDDHWFGKEYLDIATSFPSANEAAVAYRKYIENRNPEQKFKGFL